MLTNNSPSPECTSKISHFFFLVDSEQVDDQYGCLSRCITCGPPQVILITLVTTFIMFLADGLQVGRLTIHFICPFWSPFQKVCVFQWFLMNRCHLLKRSHQGDFKTGQARCSPYKCFYCFSFVHNFIANIYIDQLKSRCNFAHLRKTALSWQITGWISCGFIPSLPNYASFFPNKIFADLSLNSSQWVAINWW